MKRLRLLLPCALLLLCPWAAAQGDSSPRSYSVLSELARELTVITFQEGTGSNLDQNIRQRMPIAGGVIDRAALGLAKAQILTKEPGAKVYTFVPLDSDVFDSRQSFREGSDSGLPPDLAGALRQQGSTHLLLLTRHQAETAIQVRSAKIGAGRMEGLGFYIDHITPLTGNPESSPRVISGRGFLAPFVYVRATLIDAASGRVVRSRTHTESVALRPVESSESPHPWDALNSSQKVRMLSDMLDKGLAKVIPETLAQP